MEVMPFVEQWGRTQTLPVRDQVVYDIVIVSAKGAMDNILVSTATGGPETVVDFCFGENNTLSVVVVSTTPSIRQDVSPITGIYELVVKYSPSYFDVHYIWYELGFFKVQVIFYFVYSLHASVWFL